MRYEIKNKKIRSRGVMLIEVLVFASISVVIIGALISWAGVTIKASRIAAEREQALQIAEAGIDYYRWHLAHAPEDFRDGTATSTGPFVHAFYNKDGNVIGTYSLSIVPPAVGSTLVTLESEGQTLTDPTLSRKIRVILGIPSLAQYAMVTNSVVFYGAGDEVYGPIHSNSGVGFLSGTPQPIVHNMVTSALSTYNGQFAVYTTVSPADPVPPAVLPNRPDVFQGGRQFPVPAVDFTGITSDLSLLRAQAESADGFYRGASGGSGYKVVLKTDSTFDLYKVNSLLPIPSGCSNSQGQSGWGTWSINTTGGATTLLGTYAFPTNGVMFFEDHVWVEGQINGTRLTIAAGTFPVNSSTYKNIIVNNDLTYTNFDGTDALGLIAQGNFLIGMASADDLTIHGALVAQNGATIRYYYNGCGSWNMRNTLTTYGMFASNGQGYFYYGSSGYTHQPASYDAHFLYAPPPSFPLTSDQYQTISWEEIR